MRYAIISDIHANLDALTTALEAIDADGVDEIICLGDVVGYNANPNECCEILRERNIATILGNHDAVACGVEEPWGFNPVALQAAMWTREQLSEENHAWLRSLPDALRRERFVAVHGAPHNRNTYLFTWEDILPHLDYLEEEGCNICLIGHTHSPGIFSTDGVYSVDEDDRFELGTDKAFFINAGSVGQPRDGDARAAWGIVDTGANYFQQMRMAYPVQRAADRVRAAGLPPFLAERLSQGR